MTTEDMIRNLKRVVALYKDKPVYTGEINISCMCQDVINHLRELNEKTKWHTEMPTEEGLYVVLTKVTNKGIQSSEGAYILDWWDGYCFKNLKQMARHNPVFGNDVYSWVKWQKIEEKT